MAGLARAKVVTFIATADRARATPFYRDMLGLPIVYEDAFACVFDLDGISLRLTEVAGFAPVLHTVLGWHVADIETAIRELRDAGVRFSVYEGLAQDELGIWQPPGSATRVAWFADPDGNILSLTQFS